MEDLKVSPGDNVQVGDVIMILNTGEKEAEETEDNEEEIEKDGEEPEPDEVEIEPEEIEEDKASNRNDKSGEDILALPKVRKLAEEKNVDLASIKNGERITEEEVLEAAGENKHNETESRKEESSTTEDSSKVLATPSVRKLAREEDVELKHVEGSGKGGKVTREDVLEASGQSDNTPSEGSGDKSSDHSVELEADEKKVEMSQTRKTIADRMEKSRFTAPHVTHFDTADITDLVGLREEKKEKTDAHLTYLPFIIKAVYLAMKKHPRINSELDEENDSVVLKGHYDFNIAVDTDNGLMVPLIEEVDEKNIIDLAQEVNMKAGKAREGELSQEDMRNGTFSITNLGVIGGEEFTPIINYPQTAILGIGKIQESAEVLDGEIEPRMTVKLSLSYDHRVIDGADAAHFMNDVIENLEDPENMILEL